jgi:DNA-binding transcriptional regulator YiaG
MATPRKRLTPDEVRALRVQLGWTQARLARALAVSRITVSRWETAAARMTPSHAKLIRLTAKDRGLSA